MGKINILKSKKSNKRCGEFSLTAVNCINLKVGFQANPKLKKELFELLEKYYNIVSLSQNANCKGRGSITRSLNGEKRKSKFRKSYICSLCGEETFGHGNNPAPLNNGEGECCDQCNATKVIPVRLRRIIKTH